MSLLQPAFGAGIDRRDELQDCLVLDEEGTPIGRLDEVLIDAGRKPRYVAVRMRDRSVLLPVGALRVERDKRQVTLSGYARDRLASLRAYEPGAWSEAQERAHYREVRPDWPERMAPDYEHPAFRGGGWLSDWRAVSKEGAPTAKQVREQVREAERRELSFTSSELSEPERRALDEAERRRQEEASAHDDDRWI